MLDIYRIFPNICSKWTLVTIATVNCWKTTLYQNLSFPTQTVTHASLTEVNQILEDEVWTNFHYRRKTKELFLNELGTTKSYLRMPWLCPSQSYINLWLSLIPPSMLSALTKPQAALFSFDCYEYFSLLTKTQDSKSVPDFCFPTLLGDAQNRPSPKTE